jgi:hypothetical protein
MRYLKGVLYAYQMAIIPNPPCPFLFVFAVER